MRMRGLAFVLVSSVITAACATTHVPRSNTRSDLVGYVERAAALVERKGTAACADFSQPQWMDGDSYIFVNEGNVTVCHPARPDLVGRDETNLRDVNGVYFVREMQKQANSPAGHGWVEYMWPRPGQTTPVRKSSYVMAVNGPDGKRYVVGSGAYEMPGS